MRLTQSLVLLFGTGLVFAYFGGFTILDPSHTGWFQREDPRQHLLGWEFFRATPLWQFPLGANPGFGEAMSSSVVFSDSLPLFAILFKLLNPVLPQDFQYFGLWIGLCFLLQAGFALAVLRRLDVPPWAAVFGALLLLASPIMLWRLHGHEALVGHWMILAGIYLYLRPRPAAWGWIALIFVATGTHAYLLGMVGSVWLADLIQRRPSWRHIAGHTALVLATIGLTAWALGYFIGPGGQTGGFGQYRTTLHSWIDADGQWSHILPDIRGMDGTYEGFAYLGLGALAVLGVASLLWALGRKRGTPAAPLARDGQDLRPLVWIAAASGLFALSDRIGGFGVVLIDLDILDDWPITSIFRSSGRFIWLPTYLLLICAIVSLARHVPARRLTLGLGLAVLVQLADIHPAAAYFRDHFAAPETTRFDAPFWDEALPRYTRLSLWPRQPGSPDVAEAGFLAARYGLSIDMARLARHDPVAAAAASAEVTRQIAEADWRDDTLYLLQDDRALDHLRRIGAFDGAALIGHVDGFAVVAPNWTGDAGGLGLTPVTQESVSPPDLPDHGLIQFGSGGNADPYLGFGWSGAEPTGRWTVGPVARLSLRLPDDAGSDLRLFLKATPFVTRDQPVQPVTVFIDRRPVHQVDLSPDMANAPVEVALLPDMVVENGVLELMLEIGHPQSPQALGLGSDRRPLGLMVDYILIAD